MRFAIGHVPPPTRGKPPECVRARPVAVPFLRDPNRLESDLMRHDPAWFQPAHHTCVDARQVANELEHSLREDEICRSFLDHSHRPWGVITNRSAVTKARPWIS